MITRLKACKKRFANSEEGAALAEIAMLILPLFLCVALVFEGGRIFWGYQIAVKATRDGARYLSRVADPTLAGEQALARTLVTTGRLSGGTLLVSEWSDTSKIGITVTPVANPGLRGPATINVITVTADIDITLPFAPVFQFFSPGAPGTISFTVGDQVRHYGL